MTFLSWGIGARQEEFQTSDGVSSSPSQYVLVEPHVLGLPGDRALLAWWEAKPSTTGSGDDITIYGQVASVAGTAVSLGPRQVIFQAFNREYAYDQWPLADLGNGMFVCGFVHQPYNVNSDVNTMTLFQLNGDTITVLDTWERAAAGTAATALIPLSPGKFLRQIGTSAQYVDCTGGTFGQGVIGTVTGPTFPMAWWSDGVRALSATQSAWGFVGGVYSKKANTSAYLIDVTGSSPAPIGTTGLPVGGDSLIDVMPTTHVPTLNGGALLALADYQSGSTANVTLARVTVESDALVTNETYLVAPTQDDGYGGNNQTSYLPRVVGSDGLVYLLSGTVDSGVSLHTDVFTNPEIVPMPSDGLYTGLNEPGRGWSIDMASTENGVWAVVGNDLNQGADGLLRRALTLTWMPLVQPAIDGDYIGARRRFRRL